MDSPSRRVGSPLGSLHSIALVLHGAGNGLLTIAKGTLPLALFGPAGYGLRTGVLSVPARVAQAGAPLLFGLLLDRVGLGMLLVSSGLGLASTVALLALRSPGSAERAPVLWLATPTPLGAVILGANRW